MFNHESLILLPGLAALGQRCEQQRLFLELLHEQRQHLPGVVGVAAEQRLFQADGERLPGRAVWRGVPSLALRACVVSRRWRSGLVATLPTARRTCTR